MKELFNILCMEDSKLGSYLLKELKKCYKKVYSDGDNYLYAKGNSSMCLVAHIDTVRGKTDEPVTLACRHNVIRNTKGILGADDRAGVYGILEVMRDCANNGLPMPSIIFTNYEERGGKGVKKFILDKKFDPRGIDIFIELDRKGCNEYVFYSTTLPLPVADYVESFGFRKENGSYSDISDLTDEYLIPSVNLSIGYYAQHTQRESLHYDEMWLTIERVIGMIESPIGKLHPVPKPLYGKYSGKFGSYGSHGAYDDYYGYGYNKSTHTPAAKQPTVADNAAKTKGALEVINGGKEVQGSLNLKEDVDRAVLIILSEIKFDIMTEINNTFSLDVIADTFLNHKYKVEIIKKLEEFYEMYIELFTTNHTETRSFYIAWNKIVTDAILKLPKAQTATGAK